MRRLTLGLVALGLGVALGGCNPPLGYATCHLAECGYPPPPLPAQPPIPPSAPLFDGPFLDYSQRTVTISTGAGNSAAANLALQTDTPWPRHSQNTSIPGNGAVAARSVNEYEGGTRESATASRSLTGSGGGSSGVSVTTNVNQKSGGGDADAGEQ